jgi:hypothetical protein
VTLLLAPEEPEAGPWHAELLAVVMETLTQLGSARASADCILIKLADGPQADFNLAFRSLIRLCELTMSPRLWYVGGEVAVREITRTLKGLGEANDGRGQLSSWILDELHNLADGLSIAPSLGSGNWEEFLQALAVLKDDEIRTILRGPSLTKLHDYKGISHAWEALVIGQLYATGRSAALIASQASAVGRCANDSDLPGLIALFEWLGIEYIDNNAVSLEIQPLLATAADNIRSCFKKNHLIASTRRRADDRHSGPSISE